MRTEYLVTFAGSRLHTLVREQFLRPSITIDVAGGGAFGFSRVDKRSHAAARCACIVNEAGCNSSRGCPAESVIDIRPQGRCGVELLVKSGYTGFGPQGCPAAEELR